MVYYTIDKFEQHIIPLLTLASLYLCIRFFNGAIPVLEPAALGIIVCFFALFLFMGKFGKYGDFSYGAYIVHFPLIQLFVHLDLLQDSPTLFVSTIMAITLILGAAMWHLVEKRCLLRSCHYVKETKN